MPRNLFAQPQQTNSPRNLFAGQSKPKVENPYQGQSTDELLTLVESGKLSPEQEAFASDAISQNEGASAVTDRQIAESPELLRDDFQQKAQTRLDAQNAGLDAGLKNVGEGLLQAGGEVADLIPGVDVDTEAFTKGVNLARAEREADLKERFPENQGQVKVGKVFGEVAPALLVPGGAANSVRQLVKSGAKVGAVLGAAQFDNEGGLVERAKNTAIGGAVGGVASGVIGGALKAGSKAVNAVAGKVKDKATEDILKFAKQEGVNVSFADVTTSQLAKRVDTAAEQFGSLGSASFRAAQGKSARKAVKNFLDDLRPVGGDDAPKLIQESINNTATTATQRANGKFEQIFSKADEIGSDVALLNSRNLAKNMIKSESLKKQFADAGLSNELSSFAKGGQFTMRQAQEIRSNLLDTVRAIKAGTITSTKQTKPLEQMAKAMDFDMGRFTIKHGLHKEWRKANKFFKDEVVPLRDSQIVNSAKTDTPDEIFKKFFVSENKGAGRDRAMKLFNALDDEGRQSVRFMMVDNAYNKALKNTNNGEIFSPAQFAGELERMQKASGVFFKGQDRARLEGFKKLMRAVQRAGQFAENPPTGNRLFLPLLAGGTGIAPGTTATILGGVTTAKLLFTTKAGKRLLLASSKIPVDSPEMGAMLRALQSLSSGESVRGLDGSSEDQTQR